MDVKVTKQDGDVFTLKRIGINPTDFIVSTPLIQTTSDTLDGMHGEQVEERLYRRRGIEIPFYIYTHEFERRRDEVYRLLSNIKPFYVEELRADEKGYKFVDIHEPPIFRDNAAINTTGKRYSAYLSKVLSLKEEGGMTEGVINLETIDTPFAESVNVIKRKYTNSNFAFNNGGNQPIDMRTQTETTITFKGVSNNLEIKNLTTGDVWKYNGTTTANDTILLKGVRSLKNGQSIFGQTNHKLISFAPGNNKFEVTGTSGAFELNIATRFYFL